MGRAKVKAWKHGKNELTTDKTGFRRIVVKPHKAADLIEQPGGWGLTFHGVALVFWGSDSSKTISRTLDNGPGTFDLKLCSISYYQVKVQCQSMVR